MINPETIALLTYLQSVLPQAKLDPLGRPLLLLRHEGREWWISATHVTHTKLLEEK